MLSRNRDGDHCSSALVCESVFDTVSPQVVSCHSVLGWLLQHGHQVVIYGLAHTLVTLRGQVEVVVHVLVGDASVRVDKAMVHVEVGGMRER